MSTTAAPQIVPAGKGRRLFVLGDVYMLKLTGADTAGTHALVELCIAPGNGTPPHVHHREDETFLVLEGRLTFSVAGRELSAGPGDVVYGPRDVPHHFRNGDSLPARLLVLVTPAGFENFFVEIGEVPPDGPAKPRPPGPQDIERIKALAPRYGLELLVPAEGHTT